MNIKEIFLTKFYFRITFFILLSLVPISVLGTLIISSKAQEFLIRYAEDNLSDEGGELATAIEEWTKRYSNLVESLSREPEIISMEVKKQEPIIKAVNSLFPKAMISTYDLTGRELTAETPNQKKINYSDRFWFKEAVAGRKISVENLVGRTTGLREVCLSSPIREEIKKKIVGVLASCLLHEEIVSGLKEVDLGKTGYGFFVDKKGKVIVNTEKANQPRPENWISYPPVKAFLNNQTGFYPFHDPDTGGGWLSYILSVNSGGGVIVLKQEKEILELSQFYYRLTIIVIAITAFTVGTVTIVLTSRLTHPLTQLTVAAQAMSGGELNTRVKIDRQDELGVLANSFNSMAMELQQLIELKVKAAKTQNELEQARKIQENFLPETIPQPADWEIAAYFKPARQVAGDFYDVFELPNDQIGLVIADVCDKGVGAALFMALTRSLIRAITQESYLSDPTPLKSAIEFTNNYIVTNHGQSNMFATVFFAVLDTTTGILKYSNGGHETGIIVRADGEKVFLKSNSPAVGIIPDISYKIEQVDLNQGDIFLVYTDGVKDARSPSKEFFSEGRLLNLLDDPSLSAHKLIDLIQTTVNQHIAIAEQFDDITMLSVKRIAESTTEEKSNGK